MSRLTDQEYVKATELTFKHFDKSSIGYLDRKQFNELIGAVAPKLNFPLNEPLLNFSFDRMDIDKDGKISLQEFHNTLRGYYFS